MWASAPLPLGVTARASVVPNDHVSVDSALLGNGHPSDFHRGPYRLVNPFGWCPL